MHLVTLSRIFKVTVLVRVCTCLCVRVTIVFVGALCSSLLMPPARATITHVAGANTDASYVVYSDADIIINSVREIIIYNYT